MAASVNDKFRKASSGTRPEPTFLATQKDIADTTLSLDAATGWNTTTGIDLIIYQTDTSGVRIPGTQTDWKGTLSGTTVNDLTLMAGTDQLYTAGEHSVVMAAATAAWGDSITDGILVHADQDGTLKAGAVDNAAVLASNVVTTAKIADAAVTAAKLRSDATDHGWLEIARTTLGSAGDTISVTSIPARKYLMVQVSIIASGSNDTWIRFNNDSAANYAIRYSGNNAADTASTAQTVILLAGTETSDRFSTVEIVNIAAKEKLLTGHSVSYGASGPANAPTRWDVSGKWANTSAQITRIDVINFQAGDFAVGSEVVVLGHD